MGFVVIFEFSLCTALLHCSYKVEVCKETLLDCRVKRKGWILMLFVLYINVLVKFLALYTYEVLGLCSGQSDNEDGDEEMDDGASNEAGEVAQALEVADALGRTSNTAKSGTSFDSITDGLRELDMENYDEEDDGIPSPLLSLKFYFLFIVLKRNGLSKHTTVLNLNYCYINEIDSFA